MIFYVIVYVVIKSPLLRLLSLSVRYGLGLLTSRFLIRKYRGSNNVYDKIAWVLIK